MPRKFLTATADRVGLALGAFSGLAFFGTVAAVFRIDTQLGATQGVWTMPGTTDRLGLLLTATTGILQARIGNGLVSAPTLAVTVADGWVLCAWSKPTGTSTVRFHKYVFATNTWTHENGGTNANSVANASGSFIGAIGATNQIEGDVAAVGVWGANVLTDAQIESLAGSLMAWWQFQPTGLWLLDQAAVTQTVPDLSGGGANQNARNNTSIGTSSCPLGYGMDIGGA